MLQDDPSFLPDMFPVMMDFDLSILESSTRGSSSQSSIMSQHSLSSSRSSAAAGFGSPLGLVIPTSESGHAGVPSDFGMPEMESGLTHRGAHHAVTLTEDDGFLPDIDFAFDIEGNLIERRQPAAMSTASERFVIPRNQGDSVLGGHARQGQYEALRQSGVILLFESL